MDWLDDRAAFNAAQARSHDFANRWRDAEPCRAGRAAFADCGDDLWGAVGAAHRLLADDRWTAAVLEPLAAELSGDPLFSPPLRVHRDALRSGAVLLDCPAAVVTATVLSADALATAAPPDTLVAPGRVSVVRTVRSGRATILRWRADDRECRPLPSLRPADGQVRIVDGRCEAMLVAGAAGDVCTVTATLRPGAAPHMREYDRATGRLLRRATLDDPGSRDRMLLTLLRVSGRTDAGPRFEAATRGPGFDLRWAAMREWLALDVAAALPRLREMTADPHPEVRAAALATVPLAERTAA